MATDPVGLKPDPQRIAEPVGLKPDPRILKSDPWTFRADAVSPGVIIRKGAHWADAAFPA